MQTSNPLYSIDSDSRDGRVELREPVRHLAEVAHFPGDVTGGGPRSGFALDESDSGLCLQLEAPVPVKSLLRVKLRDSDGRIRREEIVRVAWCRPRHGGRYNTGLEVVDEQSNQRLRVQHTVRATQIAIGGRD